MRLSELQNKRIINMQDGKNIGTIIDVTITEDGNVSAFIIESGKSFFALSKEGDTEILWKDIEKIGEDVILIRKSII